MRLFPSCFYSAKAFPFPMAPRKHPPKPQDTHAFVKRAYHHFFPERNPELERVGKHHAPLQFTDMMRHLFREGYIERQGKWLHYTPKGYVHSLRLHGLSKGWMDLSEEGQHIQAEIILRVARPETKKYTRNEVFSNLQHFRDELIRAKQQLENEMPRVSPKSSRRAQLQKNHVRLTNAITIYNGIIVGLRNDHFQWNPHAVFPRTPNEN